MRHRVAGQGYRAWRQNRPWRISWENAGYTGIGMKEKLFLWVIVGLLLTKGTARAGVWHSMDWIDGWSETSTPSWQKQLGVDQVTINCSDLSVRTNAQSCVSWIQQQPTVGITQYVPYTNPSAALLLQEASDFSTYTLNVPSIPEVDIDDFFSYYPTWPNAAG